MAERGRLIVCGTPIGNLADVSDRLRETLRTVDVVYAEDTRRTAVLLRHVGASPRVVSMFAGNEVRRIEEMLGDLEQGRDVALVTDAGVPAVSDPGAAAVSRATAAGYQVSVVPGPSAVTAALSAAGVPADRFVFEGFLPKKGQERERRIACAARETRPVVFFISPHRLLADLADMAAVTGSGRRITLARELTKLHEEIWSGEIGEAIVSWTDRQPRGEFTLVLAPGEEEPPSLEEAVAEARRLVESGSSPSEAARRVAEATGVRRRSVYQTLVGDQDRS